MVLHPPSLFACPAAAAAPAAGMPATDQPCRGVDWIAAVLYAHTIVSVHDHEWYSSISNSADCTCLPIQVNPLWLTGIRKNDRYRQPSFVLCPTRAKSVTLSLLHEFAYAHNTCDGLIAGSCQIGYTVAGS